MPFRIRPAHSGDYARIAAILTAIDPEPVSLEDVAELYDSFPAEGIRQTWVGVVAADSPLAWGVVSRIPTARPGKFRTFLATEPAARNQGIGTAVADLLEQFAREHGATMIETDVRETEDYSIRFAERRGYKVAYRLAESTLDLATFDASRFAGAVERIEATGIRFATLDQLPGEESDRKLYDLYRATVPHQPGYDAPEYQPYESWRRRILESSKSRRDTIWIALDGDTFVGVANLHWIEPTRAMYNEYTGVRREYRGRGLALVLKLLSIGIARRYEAVYMRTNNHSLNLPMLAVNRKLGYVDQPGVFFYRKEYDHVDL